MLGLGLGLGLSAPAAAAGGGGDPGLGYEPPAFTVVSGAGASATEVSPNVWELSSDSEYTYIKADADVGDFLLSVLITYPAQAMLFGLYDDDPGFPGYNENYVELSDDGSGFEGASSYDNTVNYNFNHGGTPVKMYLHRSGSTVTVKRGGTSYADATLIDTTTSSLNRLWATLDFDPASTITVEFLPLP